MIALYQCTHCMINLCWLRGWRHFFCLLEFSLSETPIVLTLFLFPFCFIFMFHQTVMPLSIRSDEVIMHSGYFAAPNT